MKRKTMQDPLLNSELEVVFATPEEMLNYYNKAIKLKKEKNLSWFENHGGAIFYHFDNDWSEINKKDVLWVNSEANLPAGGIYTLVHEVNHFSFYWLSQVGVFFDDNENEVFCYFSEFIFKQVWRFIGDLPTLFKINTDDLKKLSKYVKKGKND